MFIFWVCVLEGLGCEGCVLVLFMLESCVHFTNYKILTEIMKILLGADLTGIQNSDNDT